MILSLNQRGMWLYVQLSVAIQAITLGNERITKAFIQGIITVGFQQGDICRTDQLHAVLPITDYRTDCLHCNQSPTVWIPLAVQRASQNLEVPPTKIMDGPKI